MKANTKVYHHTSGFFLVWSKVVQNWYLIKVLKSGKIKKYFADGFSYKHDWKQAVAEIRKRGLKLPSSSTGWTRHRVVFDNTVEGFNNALIEINTL